MTSQQPAPFDVIVVGAGSAGCALAARLVERGRQVLLLDGGPERTPPPLWSLAGATDPSMSRDDQVAIGDGHRLTTRRGALIGGSGAVNGGYFLHSRSADHQRWVAGGGDKWKDDVLRAVYRRLAVETWVDTDLEPVTEAFIEASSAAGFGWLDDLNGADDTGVGLVRFSARNGERVTPATAYLTPLDGHLGLTVRPETTVRRVVLENGHVQGVELADGGAPLHAAAVVLSAGAVGTAELLLRSGVGPAEHLGAHGIAVQRDLSGVGTRSANHPCIDLMYLPRATAARASPASFMQSLLHVDADGWGGAVEVMPTRRPYGVVTGNDPSDRLLSLRVTLMSPTGHGTVELGPNGQLALSAGGLGHSDDIARLVRAVRQTAQLAMHPAFADCVEDWYGPAPSILGDDDALRAWVLEHAGTAYHLCGTAPMGPAGLPGSVVDGSLRVHGIDGLRVADTSILPSPPSRGPAATAVMIGEHAADLIG